MEQRHVNDIEMLLRRRNTAIHGFIVLVLTLMYVVYEVANIIDHVLRIIHHQLLYSRASQFGAAFGGAVGLAAGIDYYGYWNPTISIIMGVGSLLGGLIYNRFYGMLYTHHNEQATEVHQ